MQSFICSLISDHCKFFTYEIKRVGNGQTYQISFCIKVLQKSTAHVLESPSEGKKGGVEHETAIFMISIFLMLFFVEKPCNVVPDPVDRS